MNYNDFRYIRRGKPLSVVTKQADILFKAPYQKDSGKKRALLLLHGFSSTPAVFRLMLPQINQYDALICPILQGHAMSIEAFSQSTANAWRESAKIACDTLFKTYETVDLLGLSLGGLLACELSQQFDFKHLFLLAPAIKLQLSIPRTLWLARLLHYLGFCQFRNAAGNLISNEHAEIAYRTLPVATIIEMLSLVQNYEWKPPLCPTDLFLGRHDTVVASEAIEPLCAPHANVTIHWLEHSAHLLPLDNDVAEIITCINRT